MVDRDIDDRHAVINARAFQGAIPTRTLKFNY